MYLQSNSNRLAHIALSNQGGVCAVTGRVLLPEDAVLVSGLSGRHESDPMAPGLRGCARSLPGPHAVGWWLMPLLDRDWLNAVCRSGCWSCAAWPSKVAVREQDVPTFPAEVLEAPFAARVWFGLLFAEEIRRWPHAFEASKIFRGVRTTVGSQVLQDNPFQHGWVLIPRTPLDCTWLARPSWPRRTRGWHHWLLGQPDPSSYWRLRKRDPDA